MAMFNRFVSLPEGKTPLNPTKPPFSYGFPEGQTSPFWCIDIMDQWSPRNLGTGAPDGPSLFA